MNELKDRKKIIKDLLNNTDSEFTDEELIRQLTNTKITTKDDEKISFGQKAADAVASFAGSWAFIFSFVAIMVVWMVLNILLATNAFDAYPFILLNLVLSCIAALQAPIIMMSQNRQAEKDSIRNQNDYRTDLKSELILESLHDSLEQILKNQKQIVKMLKEDDDKNEKN